ncbi:unnamed protein product [Acanthoscelides obtectus]|uniref:Uncharacterized protein n=1 Tax=Acanthoscelides obtectus TaxID=200917 RepID=A0A9P0M6V0_ACAOB|nr:unnamed protein product [Acanthoscelides obtectus]CAK1672220.1 hypothetical protein AOBTE_LOCUS28725 [Acanthoscelides obtectus]
MLSVIYLIAVACVMFFIGCEEIPNEPNSIELLVLDKDANDTIMASISPNNKSFVVDEVIPLQESNGNTSNRGKIILHSKWTLKPIVYDLLQKVSPSVIMQGLHDKLKDIKLYWTQPNRPNFGGVQFASPEQIWDKLHEKGHHFLTGINGAIFGLAGAENHDYPFPYRSLNKRSAND